MSMDLQALHDDLHKQIDKIDEVLDSQTNQKTAGKRTIVNQLIEKSEQTWKPVGSQLVEQLKGADIDTQIGIYYGLVRHLNNEFQKALSEAVEAKVADIPDTPANAIPEEELKSLSSIRSELYAKVKTLVEMNDTFGAGADMHMPKRRTGARGKRGPRAITAYTWEIDGQSFDKLKDVAEVYDQYEKTADLTKAMREAKIDLKNPEERIEFTLPDGKILVGTKDPDKVATEDSDDDGDTENDDDGDES
jgi:gamma-glutamylcysteine synthetase